MAKFDPEAYVKIRAVHEELQDGAFIKLPGAMEVVVEQAESSGITNLIKSCKAAQEEGVPAIIKAYQELMKVTENYLKANKKMYDAFGVEA